MVRGVGVLSLLVLGLAPMGAAGAGEPPALAPTPELAGEEGSVAGPDRLLVWRLRSLAVDEQTTARVEEVLVEALGELEGLELLRRADGLKAIAEDPALGPCDGAPPCLGRLAAAVEARWGLTGVISNLGETYALDLRLVEAGGEAPSARVAQIWNGADDALLEVARQGVVRLVRPEAYRGLLSVRANVRGVKVLVDGEFAGRTPLSEPLSLEPGRHALRLVSQDHQPFERFVDVPLGREVPVEVVLKTIAVAGEVEARNFGHHMGLALRGGVQPGAGGIPGPRLELELRVRAPFASDHLFFAGEVGTFGTQRTLETQWADGRPLSLRAGTSSLPLTLSLLFFPLPRQDFTPYLRLGLATIPTWQTIGGDGLVEQRHADAPLGLAAGAGLELRLGPGAVALDLRYTTGQLKPRLAGGFSGGLSGLSITLGYVLGVARR